MATTAITMLGPGLALRGPDGSMNRCARAPLSPGHDGTRAHARLLRSPLPAILSARQTSFPIVLALLHPRPYPVPRLANQYSFSLILAPTHPHPTPTPNRSAVDGILIEFELVSRILNVSIQVWAPITTKKQLRGNPHGLRLRM
jgi:hypothetical protein